MWPIIGSTAPAASDRREPLTATPSAIPTSRIRPILTLRMVVSLLIVEQDSCRWSHLRAPQDLGPAVTRVRRDPSVRGERFPSAPLEHSGRGETGLRLVFGVRRVAAH